MSELVRVVNGEFKGFVGVSSSSGIWVPGVPDFSSDVDVNGFQIPEIPDWMSRKKDEELMREHHGPYDEYVTFGPEEKGIYHFTSFGNLERILKTGLVVSRNLAKTISGYEKYGDERTNGELKIQNNVRTTWVSNNPIFANFEGYKTQGEQAFPPCVIEFDYSTAFLDSAVYFNGNANASFVRDGKSLEFFRGLNFHAIYDVNVPRKDDFDLGDEVNEEEYRSALKQFNSPKQAEIHFPFALPVNFIKRIYFRTNAEKTYALELMPELKSYRFSLDVNSGHFTNKTRLDEVHIRESHKTKIKVLQKEGVHVVHGDMLHIFYRVRGKEVNISARLNNDGFSRRKEFGVSDGKHDMSIDVSGLKGDFVLSLYFGDKETYRTRVRLV